MSAVGFFLRFLFFNKHMALNNGTILLQQVLSDHQEEDQMDHFESLSLTQETVWEWDKQSNTDNLPV